MNEDPANYRKMLDNERDEFIIGITLIVITLALLCL